MEKRSYEARIHEVKHGSFTALVFSATGGMANKAYASYKRLASLLSDMWNEHYAAVMGYGLGVACLHSAIQCLRGSHFYW